MIYLFFTRRAFFDQFCRCLGFFGIVNRGRERPFCLFLLRVRRQLNEEIWPRFEHSNLKIRASTPVLHHPPAAIGFTTWALRDLLWTMMQLVWITLAWITATAWAAPITPAPTPALHANPVCSICGNSTEVVTLPTAVLSFPGEAPVTCAALQKAGQEGRINTNFCPLFSTTLGVPDACKCAGVTAAPAGSTAAKPTSAPVKPTVAPIKPTVKPVAPTKKPVAPTKKPIAPTKKPIAPTKKPIAPTKKPIAPTKKPIAPTKKPVAPVKKPVAPVKKPVAPVKKPVAPAKKPVAPVKKPVAPVKKPVAPVKKPVAPTKKPV